MKPENENAKANFVRETVFDIRYVKITAIGNKRGS